MQCVIEDIQEQKEYIVQWQPLREKILASQDPYI